MTIEPTTEAEQSMVPQKMKKSWIVCWKNASIDAVELERSTSTRIGI